MDYNGPPQEEAATAEAATGVAEETTTPSFDVSATSTTLLQLVTSPHLLLMLVVVGYVLQKYVWNQPKQDSDRIINYQEEMRRVRARQQLETEQLAKQAAAARKEKKLQEAEHKADKKTDPKKKTPLKRDDNDGGYNPMQPWTSSSYSLGSRYRPQRRSARRG